MARVRQSSPQAPDARWIYSPAVDLIVGCGAWSAPLLLLAGRGGATTRTWAVAFYLLALAFNYPHFMATVYRGYHTRTEFAKYRLYTLHITALLALVAAVSHAWAALLPWIFTVYITWSPWHYSGQNFGLTMMFARRNGVAPTDRERRWLYAAFLASYAVLFISFHTGSSSDPLILSLGIPASIASPARVMALLVCGALGAAAVWRWIARAGFKPMIAPLTLIATQSLWFVVPAIAGWIAGAQAPQARYSTGVLAVMHSAQYLWITSYYARREAESSPNHTWRPWVYAATLVGGGIALFIPGPWIASYLFRADFTQSALIFTAIVNIHHFVLDGVVWKLRDRRVAALLVDSPRGAASEAGAAVRPGTRWLAGDTRPERALRVAALLVLLGWAGVDQARFILGTRDHDASALARAAALNPYDSSVQRRAARALIEQQRYPEADAQYQRYLLIHPEDGEAQLNAGVLAQRLGRDDDAVQRWEAALKTDATRMNARRYLTQLWATRADDFDKAGRTADAAHAFQRALALDEQGEDPTTIGADWFNYGQFLRRHQVEPRLVLACLLRAEELLGADARASTVRTVRNAFEREQPDAAAAVGRSPADALAAARVRY